MTGRQRRAAAVISWRAAVLLVVAKAVLDAGGLLVGGDGAYAGPSFDVLRQIPGGMRTYGPPLAALAGAAVWSLIRHGSPRQRLLRVSLALLAGWYVGWLIAVCGAWLMHRQILGWGAVGSLLIVAGLAVLTARAKPRRDSTRRGG